MGEHKIRRSAFDQRSIRRYVRPWIYLAIGAFTGLVLGFVYGSLRDLNTESSVVDRLGVFVLMIPVWILLEAILEVWAEPLQKSSVWYRRAMPALLVITCWMGALVASLV